MRKYIALTAWTIRTAMLRQYTPDFVDPYHIIYPLICLFLMSSLISHNRSCPTALIILLPFFESFPALAYSCGGAGYQYCIQHSRWKWIRDLYSDKMVFSVLFYFTSLIIPHIWFTFFSAIGHWANVYIGASIIAPRSCSWVLMASSLPICVYVLWI